MPTIESITKLSSSAINGDPEGGATSILTVNFSVFRKGVAHVAGIIYTIDGWADTGTQTARFQGFNGDSELWQAVVSVPGNDRTFQYVIYCDDYTGINDVPRVYNTNGGNQFMDVTTFF